MPRRERATILGELLERMAEVEAQGPASTTRLAARANVPYDRFVQYVKDLRDGGLVTMDDPPQLTAAGREFLDRYRQWQEALRLLGLGPGRT